MKSQFRTRNILPWMGGLVFLVACQREESTQSAENIVPEKGGIKVSGVVPSDPKKVETVPTILSEDYFVKNLPTAARGKGKPGTTTGGTTGGGTTTGDTTIVQPPPTNFPSSYALQMPPVGYQGSEFSCVPFAAVYSARSAEQYYRTGATSYSYSTNIFSPEFVYNQTKFSSDCGSGTSVVTVLEFMKNKGAATWQSMPYSSSDGCSTLPTSTQSSQALNYRIASYAKLMSNDQQGIKTMLLNRHPVIFTCDVDQNFYNARAGFVWSSFAGSMGLSHALVICGYDDARQAYKVMNSWGTGWGDAGYSWITYQLFPQVSSYYSYVIN